MRDARDEIVFAARGLDERAIERGEPTAFGIFDELLDVADLVFFDGERRDGRLAALFGRRRLFPRRTLRGIELKVRGDRLTELFAKLFRARRSRLIARAGDRDRSGILKRHDVRERDRIAGDPDAIILEFAGKIRDASQDEEREREGAEMADRCLGLSLGEFVFGGALHSKNQLYSRLRSPVVSRSPRAGLGRGLELEVNIGDD